MHRANSENNTVQNYQEVTVKKRRHQLIIVFYEKTVKKYLPYLFISSNQYQDSIVWDEYQKNLFSEMNVNIIFQGFIVRVPDYILHPNFLLNNQMLKE